MGTYVTVGAWLGGFGRSSDAPTLTVGREVDAPAALYASTA